MTTLGMLATGRANGKPPAAALDLTSLVASVAASGATKLSDAQITAAVQGWINQDDDAHEPCSLTACRHPLHPGPCKGWKGTLHSVSPGTYKQIEEERVKKANERRVKRIADLRSQGKPIPRRLLTEIQPKPAPTTHAAHNAQTVPLGQVNQKADLAGGTAHTAGQAVTKSAGVQVNTPPPLPLGPKKQKPTVAGRGPAFVITQPKVTDQYKLDKAAKITPAEWNALSDADKTTIRNELTAIKARGFGPQQKKSDELMAKLPPPGVANGLAPGTPGTVTSPSGKVYQKVTATPGKTTLGQAIKTPQLPAPAPSPKRGSSDQNGILNKPLPGGSVTSTSVGLPSGYRITRDGMGYSLKHNGKLIRTSATQKALEDYAHQHAKDNVPATNTPAVPSPSAGPTPQAPGPPSNTPQAFPPHVQHARAVAGRAVGRPTGKAHVDAYGKLSKADFDMLDSATQKTIRDDLANAKAKFLDPKKQQAAGDLLDRFGSRHTAPAAPTTPSTPAAPVHPKGYSDPQQELVKAATSGVIDTDKILQTVARLSPDTVSKLDDSDRKAVLGRLAFIATHPKATAEQKAKAQAYGRIINGGTHVPAGQKWDHAPSIGELHREEQKGGHAAAFNAVLAARDKTMGRDARVAALGALTKPQFDALDPAEQRQVTDALHDIHGTTGGASDTGKALTTYTGTHPAIHLTRQAEADFNAGKIDGAGFYNQWVHARVLAPGARTPGSPGAKLDAEVQRIAEANTKLPLWVRASMIESPYNSGSYYSISAAGNRYNWEDAPRLSSGDINDIFRADADDLARANPVHREAVMALRTHIILTGLRGSAGVPSGSPWSDATRNQVVDSLLDISGSDPKVPDVRLKEFRALDATAQQRVQSVLRKRINDQTSPQAKTGTYLALRQLEGHVPLSPEGEAALEAAADRFAGSGKLDIYRKLDPADYANFPPYVQKAIAEHLSDLQKRAEGGSSPTPWTPQDNAFKVMPAALAGHLDGSRSAYADRRLRNASDLASYGTKVVDPADRVKAYREVPIARFRDMSGADQVRVTDDLNRIAADSSNPLQVRYQAQFVKDISLGQAIPSGGGTPISLHQLVAIGAVDPGNVQPDNNVIPALNDLDKADFDKLDSVYREAIDERLKTVTGPQQQILTAKFHPQAAAATPSGFTPTAGTVQTPLPPHVQAALDTIYGVHSSGKSHTMAHQLSVYGALRGGDFTQLNGQEQNHLLGDLSFIATTAKGPSADKARKLIDRFTPPGTPSGQVPTGAIIPPVNAVAGQVRYATPIKGLAKAKDSGKSGDGWLSLPGGGRVWGHHGAAGLLLQHSDPQTGEKRYLMVQRGPAISDPGKWTFPGGASDSKETPHEGATRETIEELGLKDDVFKDALVHGDHTFTVPNSTWKYTTVAASVPTMIKPDLSTAHARAETSDAKWMTLDEIRALDKAGSLHHPIAGGKLEQNVISLYPTGGTGTTLGQIARPGPVSKRLGRLRMPSGGRQAPANFNAWPHPHKQSKGKDLIPDKTTFDAQRQKIKQDRKLYDGKTADGRLAAIGAQQGFDDTPTVLDKKEIDRLLATGDYIEAWRGVSGSGGYNWRSSKSNGKTAADINEEMRSGPAYYGKGIFGNGYYLATQRRVATQYADSTPGSIARILIPKSAITKKYDEVSKESHKNPRSSKAKGASSYEDSTFYDPGRYAAAKGIDGIVVEHHHVSPGGGARHVAAPRQPAFNWLNRSVLIVQKEPG
jgi:8-oxo-dGTP pyrophosphatase MutT (NUDIX family)